MSTQTPTRPPSDRELMRLVHGELDAEHQLELRRELERDPRLAERYRRLVATWERLELAVPAAVPPGFAARVLARARAERPGSELSWALAPVWVRAGAAMALAAGVWLGASVSRLEPAIATTPTLTPATTEESVFEVYGETQSLAESYWRALAKAGPAAGDDAEALR